MKKIFIVFCLVLFTAGMVAAQMRSGGTLYVAVRTVTLKSGTGFFASDTGTLNYGDRAIVTRVDGRFVEIRCAENSSITGWTASANMSVRQVAAGTSSTATAREVAMAGKGFDQGVEQSFRDQNESLNYDDVDMVESTVVNESALMRFLEEGRLRFGDN